MIDRGSTGTTPLLERPGLHVLTPGTVYFQRRVVISVAVSLFLYYRKADSFVGLGLFDLATSKKTGFAPLG